MKKILLLLTSMMLLHAEDSLEKDEKDPYENLNRVVFNVSDSLDESFLKPTAQIYRDYTPLFVLFFQILF